MTRRLLHGFCRVAIAFAFLASGIEAHRPVLTGPPTFGDNPRARQRESANQQSPGRGQSSTRAPDRRGCTEQEARGLLAKARLSVGDVTRVEADIKPGTVLKQTHTPGSLAAVGTPVGFALAIPRRGLDVVTIPDGGRGGRGGRAAEGQRRRRQCPNLSGRTEQEARGLLAKFRLSVGDVTRSRQTSSLGPYSSRLTRPAARSRSARPSASPSPFRAGGSTSSRSRAGAEAAEAAEGFDTADDGARSVGPYRTGGTEPSREVPLERRRRHKSRGRHQAWHRAQADHTPGSQVAVGTPVGFALAIPRRGLGVVRFRAGAKAAEAAEGFDAADDGARSVGPYRTGGTRAFSRSAA